MSRHFYFRCRDFGVKTVPARFCLSASILVLVFFFSISGFLVTWGHCESNFASVASLKRPDPVAVGRIPDDLYQGIGIRYFSHPQFGRPLLFNPNSPEIQAEPDTNQLTLAPQFILPSDTAMGSLTKNQIRPLRLAFASSTVVAANWIIYESFKDVWWSREKSKFHFYRGWRRTTGYWDLGPHDSLWFHMDKLGHIYSARLLAQTFTDLGHWVGFRPTTAYWTGAVISSLLMFEIELYDSQFKDWGFSIGDFLANEIGAFAPLMRYHFPLLNDFALKLSYRPSAEFSQIQYFVEDYAGMTFWLSMPIYRTLPSSIQQVWPQFLHLALGYSVTRKAHGETELFLALDYQLSQFAPKSGILATLLRKLDYLHLPAPTIRFRPASKAFLFYF